MTLFLTFANWNPAEKQKHTVIDYKHTTMLNMGRPWLCKDATHGLTGVVGMVIEANTPEEAMKKIDETIDEYKKNGKTPNVWGE